ncbi:MAG TPA: hypothetical protein VFG14_10450 [Chthoniobacteraceae bacterium]|nr:hypothetical protein [Chthoniobacteraceae bacterium]
MLLETEQVLSGLAPRLLRYTDRIRKEGWIRPMRSEATCSFRKYAIIVPIVAVREILAALERASAVYYPHHLAVMRLVEHWREIYGTYPESQ